MCTRPSLVALLAAVLVGALAVPAWARLVRIGTGTPVVVGTTPVALDDTSISNALPRYVLVCNRSGNGEVRLGGEGVTLTTGLPLRPGQCWHSGERIDPSVVVYGVAASSQTVDVLEVL